MSSQPPPSIELELAEQYDREHALVCRDVRPLGLPGRLFLWREEWVVRRALKAAGEPGLVLDMACGVGRYWPVLMEHGNRVVLAADNSQEMLDHAQTHHSAPLLKRIKTFQSSAFSIGLSANAVDCIFCGQLFHYLAASEHRLAMLREFHRVSRDTVIVSLWVDGIFRVGRQRRRDGGGASSMSSLERNRCVLNKAVIEAEFKQAGFSILRHQDVIPGCAMRRVYVLCKEA